MRASQIRALLAMMIFALETKKLNQPKENHFKVKNCQKLFKKFYINFFKKLKNFDFKF